MRDRSASVPVRYGIALASIVVAVAIRWALTPLLGATFPLATIFTAVVFVVWRAGAGPALLTVILGWLAGVLAFRSAALSHFTFNEAAQLLLYLIATLPIVALGDAVRRAHSELENKVEAQSLLAAIVASSDDAIISKTLDGVVTSWNRGAERLFGWRAHEIIGRPIHLIVPQELHEQERGFLEALRHGERIERQDVLRIRKDATPVPVSIRMSPVYDRHGHIIGASSTASDITQRKAWETALMRSEEAQRLLVEIHDATRGIEDASAVMREIVMRVGVHFDVTRCAYGEFDGDQLLISRGYTRGVPTVAGRYSIYMFGPGLAEALQRGETAVISDVRSHPLTQTPVALDTYARMRIVSMVVVPLLRARRLTAMLVMCDDHPRQWADHESRLLEQVAERTLFAIETARAAAALRENRDVLQLAMSTARMGAWTRDLVRGTAWWSPEFAALLGLPEAGPYDVERVFAHARARDRALITAEMDRAFAEHREYALEFESQDTTTGEWRWLESRGRAVYSADRRPILSYGVMVDITERRRAVEQLREADRRKDEFLATLAHELRNPLAPIAAGLRILQGRDSSQASAALEMMERQVKQMVRLVDDLMDVARINTGKIELRCEPIDIASAVRNALETSAPNVGTRQMTVTVPPEPVYVNADHTRLAQVFANLLNNAAKYSDPEQPIAVTVERTGGDAVVRVRDAGIGIAADMLPRVFEMFHQVERTGGWARGGLGIGLSLVKRIVEMHGGTVTAHSAGLNHGSEFIVRIPVVDPPAHATLDSGASRQDAVLAHANGTSVRHRILVVDDNEDAAESLATLLRMGGHEARTAHDGTDALAAAEAYRPDIVFLDIGMPTLDGHDTARLIRRQPWGKDVVLVALTGWGQADDRRRSKDAGFNHHLVKPADPAQVEQLLATLTH